MAPRLPLSIKLTRRAVARRDLFCELVQKAVRPCQADAAFAFHAFAFKADEDGFARELMDRRTELWLFRSNQRASCGDFLAVDMSSPWPARRRAYVIELKRGMPVRLGGGAVGVQLRNAASAVQGLAQQGDVLGAEAAYVTVAGDGAEIAAMLGRGGRN
ncbi:hypothetical protein [Sorangium sp. So ce542]|uniref:Uncharacterized protein n=1 Tax=Sorangium cellulosum TaxID=56 RepID=A0A150TRP8_SORCE|nr:hypothetical protein BE21_29775 [Sorangium cellulosum]